MKDSRSAKKPAKGVAEVAAAATPTDLDLPVDGGIRLQLPGFEGPLDLLLHLIQEHELDILNIPIAFVTQKYLEYIRLMEVLNIDIASEYLVMAATLAHIKSRMLLPTPPADDEEAEEEELDPRAELIRRLLEYQKYKKAGEELAARSVLGRDVFVRGAQPPADPTTAPLAPVSSFKLLEAFQRVLSRAKIVIDHQIEFERFSLSDRINQLVDLLKDRGRVLFEDLFEGQRSRADLIVTFLALLELTRLRMTRLFQEGSLEPIHVELAVSEGDANAPVAESVEVPEREPMGERSAIPPTEQSTGQQASPGNEPEDDDLEDFDLDSLGLELDDEDLEEGSEEMSPAPKTNELEGSAAQPTDVAVPVHPAETEGEALSELSPASEAREFEESEESLAEALGSLQPPEPAEPEPAEPEPAEPEPAEPEPAEFEEQYTPTLRPAEDGADGEAPRPADQGEGELARTEDEGEGELQIGMVPPAAEVEEQYTPTLRPTEDGAEGASEGTVSPGVDAEEEQYTPTLRPAHEEEGAPQGTMPLPAGVAEESYTPTLRPSEGIEEPLDATASPLDLLGAGQLNVSQEGEQAINLDEPTCELAEEHVPEVVKVEPDAPEAIEPCGGRLPDAESLPSDDVVVSSARVEPKLKQ